MYISVFYGLIKIQVGLATLNTPTEPTEPTMPEQFRFEVGVVLSAGVVTQ